VEGGDAQAGKLLTLQGTDLLENLSCGRSRKC